MTQQETVMATRPHSDNILSAGQEREPQTLEELNRVIAESEPFVPGGKRAVLGEGPVGAAVAFVGEQPGDQEDLQGRPFVGPAGRLLDRAMTEAGIDRQRAYVTNAVKHFKFEPRGKRRIHQRPTAGEVRHYRWWLERELDLVHPKLVVALGATAVLALAGRALPISRARGEALFDGRRGYITVHPSSLLRIPDEEAKGQAYAKFLHDMRRIRTLLGSDAGAAASASHR
jgi:DNA polymerase